MDMMAGTLAPEQMAQQQRQQMMVDALRAGMQQSPSVQRAGNVVSAGGGVADSFNTNALGGALGNLGGNLGTAFKYDTNPFSQQTAMLRAQDAGF